MTLSRRIAVISAATMLVVATPTTVSAQQLRSLPEIDGLETVEKRGERVPRNLSFRNTAGQYIALGSLIDDTQPVLLSLNYTRCPQLCGLQIQGILDGLRETGLTPGVDYRYVSVSIDPLESYLTAATQRTNFITKLDQDVEGNGVEFLTGSPESIRDLAAAVGFKYRYLQDKKQYAHPPVLIALTPEGVISRYFYSIKFDGPTLKYSLDEAADGQLSSIFEKIVMTCFHYNSVEGRYTLAAWGAMRLGGVMTLIVLAGLLIPTWLRAARKPAFASENMTATETPVSETDIDANGGLGTIRTDVSREETTT